jgi:NADH-quinone oxidoreductase subunit L
MVTCLFFYGLGLVGGLILYSRWLGERSVLDISWYALVLELVGALLGYGYLYLTECTFFLHLGSVFSYRTPLTLSIVFAFDAISGAFFGILAVALIICFFFLVEYFEYDGGGGSIILLSALFSQVALWYFCSFDLLSLLGCWEIISLISFFLVQHWSYRLPTYKAGLKVFVISQIGDVFFFLFVLVTLNRALTTELAEILSQVRLWAFEFVYIPGFGLVSLVGFLAWALVHVLFLKAAQFLFYPWLLDAMEAPVPISAQLHSSTLVIIGFYPVIRFSELLALAPFVQGYVIIVGTISVVGMAILGFYQEDGKKLLACSTSSQLGYVVVALGLGLVEESMSLLAFCCCNKAVAFVWFGALMNRCGGVSDFRFIGGQGPGPWAEHGGLLLAIGNFTIFPGAFSWHIKILFVQGELGYEAWVSRYALDTLMLTWFFSSLYLWSLYISLFLRPHRSAEVSDGEASLPLWAALLIGGLCLSSFNNFLFYGLVDNVALGLELGGWALDFYG